MHNILLLILIYLYGCSVANGLNLIPHNDGSSFTVDTNKVWPILENKCFPKDHKTLFYLKSMDY